MSANTTTAADLAALFGTVKERVDSYNTERAQLANSLREIVSNAQQLLQELGEGVSAPGPRRRGRPAGSGAAKTRRGPGRPKGSAAKTSKAGGRRGRRKGSKMSPEARARIAEAQRKRWAKVRAESK
jgi:hypothetical protein